MAVIFEGQLDTLLLFTLVISYSVRFINPRELPGICISMVTSSQEFVDVSSKKHAFHAVHHKAIPNKFSVSHPLPTFGYCQL